MNWFDLRYSQYQQSLDTFTHKRRLGCAVTMSHSRKRSHASKLDEFLKTRQTGNTAGLIERNHFYRTRESNVQNCKMEINKRRKKHWKIQYSVLEYVISVSAADMSNRNFHNRRCVYST